MATNQYLKGKEPTGLRPPANTGCDGYRPQGDGLRINRCPNVAVLEFPPMVVGETWVCLDCAHAMGYEGG